MNAITEDTYEAIQARIDAGEKIACETSYGPGRIVYVTAFAVCVKVYKVKVMLPLSAVRLSAVRL